jgi:hypothetical protein
MVDLVIFDTPYCKKLKKKEKLLEAVERKYTKIRRYSICIVSNFDTIAVDLYL